MSKRNVLAVLEEAAEDTLDPSIHRILIEARATVAGLMDVAKNLDIAHQWWLDNQDSPKSALSHFAHVAEMALAAIAKAEGQ